MLTQLAANNFKSWPTLGPMRLAPITGLFGTNSSGKTSVLQLLLMLKQTVESSDRATVIAFGDESSLTNLGSFRDVVFAHSEPGRIDFSLEWKLEKTLKIEDPVTKGKHLLSGDQMSFRAGITENSARRLIVDELEYGLSGNTFAMRRKGAGTKYELSCMAGDFQFKRNQGRVWELPSPVKFFGFPDQVYAYYQNAGFVAALQLEFESLLKGVSYLGPLREFPQRHYKWAGSEPNDMGRRGERVVDAILASRDKGNHISLGYKKRKQSLEQRLAHWLQELGLIHEFMVEAIAPNSKLYHVRVQKVPGASSVLITDVGFGVSQVLPVLVLCYYAPEGSTILLEQPEIHLHPSVQSGLADVFIDVVKNRGIQIIFESHSEHLLRRLQRRMAEECLMPKDVALYFCEVSKDGSALRELDVDLFGNIRNWPRGFFGDEFAEMAAMTDAAMKRAQPRPA